MTTQKQVLITAYKKLLDKEVDKTIQQVDSDLINTQKHIEDVK